LGLHTACADVSSTKSSSSQANIYAARGTVWLTAKTGATGALIGVHVRIGVKVELTLDRAFKSTPA
jgi:hypothetical protein